ncbi:MAG: flagellar basal body P-ring formation chaperone FlgA [Gammaproteobacteria bacterium]|nr:flagellar basal body P-ring formation chaperone FlgA [Gammaproteobacteria bacterium]
MKTRNAEKIPAQYVLPQAVESWHRPVRAGASGGGNCLLTGVLAVWLLGCSSALADAFQDLDQIIDAVSEFAVEAGADRSARAGGTYRVEVGALDSRLRLAACGTKLTVYAPPGTRSLGNTTVGVRCKGPRPWSLYVPVAIKLYGEAVVAARPLAMASVLKLQDVRMAQVELSAGAAGVLTDPQQVVGKVLRRPLPGDMVVTLDSLEEPRLVRRDEQVILVAEGSGMEVRMQGRALTDGVAGELIKVRNLGSKRVIEGTVVAPGLIRVHM